MKKIYSFMLMATMLLIGTGVKAATLSVPSTDYADLKAAFTAAEDGDIVLLTDDLSVSSTLQLDLADKKVTLDLGGKILTMTATDGKNVFELYRGDLTVKNGEIIHSGTTSNSTSYRPQIFYVLGTVGRVAPGKYTHLTIESTAKLTVSGGKGCCIAVDALTANKTLTSSTSNVDGVTFKKTLITGISATRGFANGVLIDVKGELVSTSNEGYCIKVNGYVAYPGDHAKDGRTAGDSVIATTWNDYVPQVKLHTGSTLTAHATHEGAAAIYSAGYAIWDIQCNASGACALAVKSGDVTVTNTANLTTTASHNPASTRSSGIDATGSAILVESNSSYSGHIAVTISGDAHIESEHGYAMEEVIPTPMPDGTSVSSIDIEGGSLKGSEERGVIAISTGTWAKHDEEHIISIGGGEFSEYTDDQKTLIENIISGTENSAIELTGTSSTITSLVITQGVVPDAVAENFDSDDLMLLNSDPTIVEDPKDWNSVNLAEVSLTPGDSLKLSADLYLKDIFMNCENAVSIVIPNGMTLTARRIVMNDNANITVQAGGKLVVFGDQGVTANNVNNIKIEAKEGNMGLFLCKPSVISNRHPHGTVELISKAHKVGNTYISQRFGVPDYNGLKIADIKKIGHSYTTYYYYYDIAEDKWTNITSAQYEMQPFTGYAMNSVASTGNNRYAFPCESLFGNANAYINVVPGWNYIANSYTGEIDLRTLLTRFMQSNTLEAGMWFHLADNTNRWADVSATDILEQEVDFEISKIAPMMGMVAHSVPSISELVKDTIDYESMVWEHRGEANVPIVKSNNAPARRNVQASDYTKAIVVIANGNNEQQVTLRQSAQYSDEFDNGADVSKFKAGEVSLYANTENGEQSQVATDNLMGQTLSIESAKAATFKMTFKNLRGETLAIRDNMTGSVINMTEGEEYYFSVAAGTTADRFEIVEAAKMPTDVEMLEAAPAKKGIYTLVGQYLGENFDVLPAGIYVVNGKKVVK